MFLNKVHDQKVELLRAVFRNMYLKEKCDYLDSECKMLADHVLSSQVTKAEQSELIIALETELCSLRQIHDQKLQELAIAQEHLASMSMMLENTQSYILTSLNENKSMNEELEIKDDMIKCLQEELVHVRLQAAEQWALIRELRQIKDELEKDKEMLTKTKPETISRLQEKLMEFKVVEAQFGLELDKIKQLTQQIKAEVELHKKEVEKEKTTKAEGNVLLSKKGVIWKTGENNTEKTELKEEIQKLESEKLYLQSRIPSLQNKIEILNKHAEYKEVERRRLQEKLDSFKVKHQSIENITSERRRQIDHLKNSASEKVCAIRNNTEEKKQSIEELSEKLQEMSERRQSFTGRIRIKETTTVQTLEQQIVILENRMSQLKSETVKLCSTNRQNEIMSDNM
ncbi:hypothetical protein Zmor_007002 [Zophobas morio]|uniref:Uncharacterized protein n=1 Tax=Zophobas morio TaxID=2755281 RepID=A0AA38MNX9_9CUCU|nr:hypothetical protein Zmor_007002 [Zophobas morio]